MTLTTCACGRWVFIPKGAELPGGFVFGRDAWWERNLNDAPSDRVALTGRTGTTGGSDLHFRVCAGCHQDLMLVPAPAGELM